MTDEIVGYSTNNTNIFLDGCCVQQLLGNVATIVSFGRVEVVATAAAALVVSGLILVICGDVVGIIDRSSLGLEC